MYEDLLELLRKMGVGNIGVVQKALMTAFEDDAVELREMAQNILDEVPDPDDED